MKERGERGPLLELASNAAAAAIVLDLLEEAEHCLARLRNRRDRTALHDFRVAVRRLRSMLRTYAPWLGSAVCRSARRSLREITLATNQGRDAEVQAAWIKRQRPRLVSTDRTTATQLLSEVRPKRQVAARGVGREFRAIATELRSGLRPITDPPPAFRAILGPLVDAHIAELRNSLDRVGGVEDVAAAHEARIRAKRLRYLVEPVARELPQGGELLDGLRDLQELLGELHDAHVLEATLRRARRRAEFKGKKAGLDVLVARNIARRDRLFAGLKEKWTSVGAETLFASLRRAMESLRA
jgi:CHAD domain-containing protein